MRKIAIIILLNALFCASLFCKDIGESIKNDASSLWSLPHDKFKTAFGPSELYKWQAFNKTLSYNFASGKAKLYFLGQQIYKASFKFPAKRVNGMYLTFSKAPATTDKDTYLKIIKDLQDNINNLDKFPPPKLNKRKSGKWYRYTCSWKSSRYAISLKWAYLRKQQSKFQAQNTKLSIFYKGSPTAPKKTPPEKEIANAPDEKTGPAAVKTVENNGANADDIYLKVPMIVEKSSRDSLNTCTARVMKYYAQQAGESLDDKQQTVVNNSSSHYLMNPANVRYDIKKMLKREFSVKEVMSPECFDDFIKFSSLIYAYNGFAVRKINKRYKIKSSTERLKRTNYMLIKVDNKRYVYLVNMVGIILKMNEESTWIKTRCRRKSTVKRFKKKIYQQIIADKPVVWDVILGIVKEKNTPSVRGKYVRLIIGYNDKTNELIYSDSLGKGHELKKMSWDKAWAITCKTVTVKTKKKSSL